LGANRSAFNTSSIQATCGSMSSTPAALIRSYFVGSACAIAAFTVRRWTRISRAIFRRPFPSMK
jgi:hypothetical protein